MIADAAFHRLVWLLLRVLPFRQARAAAARIGSLFPALRTAEEARELARSIARRGTCLSRSMTVASRTPSASLVIGVRPHPGSRLFAHAWVEMDGAPLEATEPAGEVIARLDRDARTAQPRT